MNQVLRKHYEDCLANHGPNHRGLDWPIEKDIITRFNVMSDLWKDNIIPDRPTKILDLGCGLGWYWDYLEGVEIDYTGIDISEIMIEGATIIRPRKLFECRDVLENPLPDNSFDYVFMNGLLTVKASNTQEQMWDFAKKMILAAYKTARIGIAFNVMSKHVDWERDDLFHVGFGEMAEFLTKEVSLHFVFRADYGLYEYCCYVYKDAR